MRVNAQYNVAKPGSLFEKIAGHLIFVLFKKSDNGISAGNQQQHQSSPETPPLAEFINEP